VTARCGGATSSLKPGVGAQVVIDGGLITYGLGLIGPWLLPFAALLDGFIYEALTQCGDDPPPMPVFDASDVVNLVGGVLNPNLSTTLSKINDALLNWAWGTYCHCDSGAELRPPLPLPAPIGVTQTGPSLSAPCFSGQFSGDLKVLPANPQPGDQEDLTQLLFPTLPGRITLGGATPNFTGYQLPPDVRFLTITLKSKHYAACSTVYADHIQFKSFNSSQVLQQSFDFGNQGPGGVDQWTVTIPITQGTFYVYLSGYSESGGGCGALAGTTSVTSSVACTSTSSPLASCCPPDPTITVGIRNILNAIANISVGDGGQEPVNWRDGVRHSSLENAGSFLLEGNAIGLRVEMTTLPSGVQVSPGNPDFYWDSGFITPYSNETPLRGARLVFRNQSFQLPKFADQVGYTLLHGTKADMIELLPVF